MKIKTTKIQTLICISTLFYSLPVFAITTPSTLRELIILIVESILNPLIPIIITIGIIVFFWGIANFILHAGNKEKHTEGRNLMVYGILIFFVMISVWGLVAVLRNTFGI